MSGARPDETHASSRLDGDDAAELLFSAGAMGARVRAFDWTTSPLGPIAGWSRALKGNVSTLLAAQVPIALFWGPDHIAFHNDACAAMIGDTHARMLGRPARESWPELWDELGSKLDRARGGESIAAKDRSVRVRRHGHDEEVYYDASYSPVRDSDGAIGGVLCVVAETTDRVRAQRRAVAERERLKQMFEQAPGFMALLTEPGHVFELANAAFHQLIGTRALIGRAVADALPETVEQGLPRVLDEVVRSGRPFHGRNLPLELQRTPGDPIERRLLNFVYQPVFDDDGRVSGLFVEGTDVTERVRAEERAALSEDALRLAAEIAALGTWDWDIQADTLIWNDATKAMFGVAPGKACGIADFHAALHPEDRQTVLAAFDAMLDPMRRMPYDVEYRAVGRQDGIVRWVAAKGRAIFDESDVCVRAVGIAIDVTDARLASEALERRVDERTGELAAANRILSAQIEERERVEATLRQMQRLEAVGQLTSGVAHEFNNLLTVILGNLDMMARTAGADPDARILRQLGTMRSAAERGATLTRQLLAFSRRQRLEARAIDLTDCIAGTRDLLQGSMGGSVRLETRAAPGLWPALVDPTQIELIILNLAINARDAMQVGGTLLVEAANVTRGEPGRPEEPAPGDYVMIAVTDSGAGMTPDVLERAFEPFFTTKEVGKGSGLGLAQVYGFAKQSGGGVAIDTAPGRGTTVRVYLPRARALPQVAAATPPPAPDLTPSRARGRRMLVVDDDPPVREITASVLRDMGALVTEAASGADALAALEAAGGAFDLMVADFAMPGMNGAELAAAATRRWPALPVLFVTGYADLTAIAGVREDRIVQKPFRAAELTAKVTRLLSAS